MFQPTFQPFLHLSDPQQAQLHTYASLLIETNEKINLISRKTAPDEVWERHIVHCLALTQHGFPDGAKVVDWGTGGGLPGLVLAICYPKVAFHLVDSTGKKINAVCEMADKLGLQNVFTHHVRAEQFREKVNFAVSRATAPLVDLWTWFRLLHQPCAPVDGCWQADLVCLKGGDLTEEIRTLKRKFPRVVVAQQDLYAFLGQEYFKEKAVVTVKMTA